jgi:hypothetical protein
MLAIGPGITTVRRRVFSDPLAEKNIDYILRYKNHL